ncbi:MAG: DUF2784 domain-containing protein [Gammaproteobacteria bacterium]
MATSTTFRLAADIVLILHASFVLFVIVGLLLVFIGKFAQWGWVRNFWFRAAHLGAIGLVLIQSWFRVICPLTELEMLLRVKGGDATYPGGFMAHWVETLLYYEAPFWIFTAAYTVLFALVCVSWFWIPPRLPKKFSKRDAQ